jgi:hypothetical protein
VNNKKGRGARIFRNFAEFALNTARQPGTRLTHTASTRQKKPWRQKRGSPIGKPAEEQSSDHSRLALPAVLLRRPMATNIDSLYFNYSIFKTRCQ